MFLCNGGLPLHNHHDNGPHVYEVIGGLVDGAIPLEDEGVGVIKDTLAILASKEIKLTTLRR